MPLSEDRFKKYQEAGVEFLESARARAEEFLRELSRFAEPGQRHGLGSFEDLVESSRRGTEQLIGAIRKEVAQQLSSLGVATSRELAELERRLRSVRSSGIRRGAGKAASSMNAAAKKVAAAKKASGSKGAARKAGATKKATGTKRAAGAKTATATKRTAGANKATGTKRVAGANKATGAGEA
jgi:hypothetical protein